MPNVDGQSVSPDEAIHRGLCLNAERGSMLEWPAIMRKVIGGMIQMLLVFL
jgi:hypothetical protein